MLFKGNKTIRDLPVTETRTSLNDLMIREALVRKLANQKPKPRAIVEELRVHNGNAIADVVALHSEAHCYEIKGCSDKIDRISIQGKYYNKAFRRITLVTTERNLNQAIKISPRFWGVIIARPCLEGVKFSHVRKAALNQNFDKEIAVMTLWKSEMLKLVKGKLYQNKPRDYLAKLIAKTKREFELSVRICNLLISRQREIKSSPQISASCILLGSPTYFTDVSAEMKALLDRSGLVALANGGLFRKKIGAAVVAVRRGGGTHAFDTINHMLLMSGAVVPGSTYWNLGFGLDKGDVKKDAEALRNMKDLGETIAWLGEAIQRHPPVPTEFKNPEREA